MIYGWNVTGEVGLYRSADGGHTWEIPDAPELHAAGGALSLAAHPNDPQQVYAGSYAEDLYRSSDGGHTWHTLARSGCPTTTTAATRHPSEPS